jgi:hypothetical protein
MNTKNFVLKILSIFKENNYSIVSRLHVTKLAYLLEREYFKKNSSRLTSISYVKFYYGPYDVTLIDELENFKKENIIEASSEEYDYSISNFKPSELNDIPKAIIAKVNSILKENENVFDLVEFVHQFPEVKEAKLGEVIDFSKIK